MDIGKVKALLDRQRTYISWGQAFILAYLFIDKVGFKWWFLLLFPLWAVWILVDAKYILPRERSYLDKQSAVLKEIRDNQGDK